MKVHRTYSDNGKLIGYKVTPTARNRALLTKEMATRGARYATAHKRTQLVETLMPFIIIILNTTFLSVWYLINN